MNLPEFSIRRPVTVLMACFIAILLGGIAFVQIPVDLMPETEFPTITVNTSYQGVAPEEMETLVTRPLEQVLASAPGVEEITSVSAEGRSNVRVRFAYGTDLDEAANELRSRIDRRRNTLPADIDPPTLFKFDVSQFPIMFLTVASVEMDSKQLRHFVEKNIQYRIERASGVAQARVSGGLRRQIHVYLDLRKLRAIDLPVSSVVDTLRRENLNRPVGPVREGRYEVLLRTQGEFSSLSEILNVAVTTRNGVPVYLRDIATVEDAHEELRYLVTVNDEPAIRLMIDKQSGANTVRVSDAVWREVEAIQRDYPEISIEGTWDSADFIRASINNVQESVMAGALLAVVVLLFFLRSFASTFIIGVAIPISVIATFALMYFNGFTLNTVSFGALALGVGMLVDSSIVVLENIFRHREEGKPIREASIIGSREVTTAIIAATLTTIAVFVPVLFMGGISAQTFQQLAWVVSFALFCSLIISLTVVPVLCSRYLHTGRKAKQRGGRLGRLVRWLGSSQEVMAERYGGILSWALDHRKTVVAVAVVLFVAALYMMPLIGVELEPEVDEGQIRVNLELEPGTHVEVTHDVVLRMARIVRERVPEARYIMTEAGSSSPFRVVGTNEGALRVDLVPRSERSRTASAIANELRPLLQLEPGMLVRTRVSGGTVRRGRGFEDTSDRLSVEVRGHDLETTAKLADQVREAMLETPGVVSAELSRRPGIPEMLVSIDRAKASSMGLRVSEVADTLETAIGGTRASLFREAGDEYDIVVRLREEDRLDVSQVGQVPLSLPDGRTIPAESIVRLRRQEGPVQINRADQQRMVTVNGTIANRDLGSIVADLRPALAAIDRPEHYEIRMGGEYEEQQEAFFQMTLAAILALLLVYMVMAAQFESLRDPFIIIFSIPLALIGITLMLVLTNTTFSMQAFLGVIVLVGIVVNNAIVLVDYIKLLQREHGLSIREAVVTGGSRRLRPILMTTVTTVLGLTPMALGLGEGGELQAPLARVVIGGLTTSALITLVFIPVVYAVLEERRERVAARRAAPITGPLRPVASTGD